MKQNEGFMHLLYENLINLKMKVIRGIMSGELYHIRYHNAYSAIYAL